MRNQKPIEELEYIYNNDFYQYDELSIHDQDIKTCVAFLVIDIVKENFDYSLLENEYKTSFKDYDPSKNCGIRLGDFIYSLKKQLEKTTDPIFIGGQKSSENLAFTTEVFNYYDSLPFYGPNDEEFSIINQDLLKIYDLITPENFKTIFGNPVKTWFHDSTPADISNLARKILEKTSGSSILDLCSGQGSFLFNYIINSENKPYTYSGIEINEKNVMMTRIKAKLTGIDIDIQNCDLFDIKTSQKYDKIFCEPTFGSYFSPTTKTNIKQNSVLDFPATTSSEWAYISAGLNLLSENGKFIAIVPNGITTNIKDETYRKQLVEQGYVEAVIQLPNNVLYGTNIFSNMLVISRNNKTVKFIDAHNCTLSKPQKIRRYQSKETTIDIETILSLLDHLDNQESTKLATIKDIKNQNYVLLPERYIDNNAIFRHLPNPKTLDEISTQIFRGVQLSSKENEKLAAEPGEKHLVKLVTASNIQCAKIHGDFKKIKDDPKRFQKFYLEDGDIIVSARGSSIKAGVAELKNDELFVPAGGTIVIRLQENYNPYYICAYLESKVGQTLLSQLQTGTILKLLNASAIAKLQVPFLNNPIHCRMLARDFENSTGMLYSLKKQVEDIENKNSNLFNSICRMEG